MIDLYTTKTGLRIQLAEGATPEKDVLHIATPDGRSSAWVGALDPDFVLIFRDLQIEVEAVIQAYAQHSLGRARQRAQVRQALAELIDALGVSGLPDYTVGPEGPSVVLTLGPEGARALAARIRGEQ